MMTTEAPEQEAPVAPSTGLTYETVEIKVTPQRDIVAWRRRVIKGELQDSPQGPFHAQDIYLYTQNTLGEAMSKRQSVTTSPSGLSPQIPLRKLSEPDDCTGKRLRGGESPTIDSNNFTPFSHGT